MDAVSFCAGSAQEPQSLDVPLVPPLPPPPNRPPNPPPPNPVVHVLPPVEVMRTVVAVTAPVLLAVPNALTQSPTATADDVVAWVSDSVVDFPVVILSFCVLGFVCFVDFELDERKS